MTAEPVARATDPRCEACGLQPADDEVIRGLCKDCASVIDVETDRLIEDYLLDVGWDW